MIGCLYKVYLHYWCITMKFMYYNRNISLGHDANFIIQHETITSIFEQFFFISILISHFENDNLLIFVIKQSTDQNLSYTQTNLRWILIVRQIVIIRL
jgi:hypothetical protein